MIAITMGDPAGIGPEVTVKGFAQTPRRLHIGDPEVYRQTVAWLGQSMTVREVASPEEAATLPPHHFAVLPVKAEVDAYTRDALGKPNPAYAAATVESIQVASRLAMAQRVSAIVTPPIHKAVLHTAGFTFPGHTELLAHCAGVDHPVMMLVAPHVDDAGEPDGAASGAELRVVPATVHQSLASVATTLTPTLLRTVLRTTYDALRKEFALAQPRIAVAGLNPHAGERGAFGHEEERIIAPVCRSVAAAWPHGTLCGPLPADTLFHPEARKTYDAVVCMYHDQALIPLKTLAFGRAVNITLGLPFVRTSVDHGTAYGIAGLGSGNPISFVQAVAMATALAHNRHAWVQN